MKVMGGNMGDSQYIEVFCTWASTACPSSPKGGNIGTARRAKGNDGQIPKPTLPQNLGASAGPTTSAGILPRALEMRPVSMMVTNSQILRDAAGAPMSTLTSASISTSAAAPTSSGGMGHIVRECLVGFIKAQPINCWLRGIPGGDSPIPVLLSTLGSSLTDASRWYLKQRHSKGALKTFLQQLPLKGPFGTPLFWVEGETWRSLGQRGAEWVYLEATWPTRARLNQSPAQGSIHPKAAWAGLNTQEGNQRTKTIAREDERNSLRQNLAAQSHRVENSSVFIPSSAASAPVKLAPAVQRLFAQAANAEEEGSPTSRPADTGGTTDEERILTVSIGSDHPEVSAKKPQGGGRLAGWGQTARMQRAGLGLTLRGRWLEKGDFDHS